MAQNTGKVVWRFKTVALKGEPGGDSWGDLPDEFRQGAETWIAGTYDPELNTTYWGTAQAKPWTRATRGSGSGATLYANATLALDPDNGKLKWFYSHAPGEALDLGALLPWFQRHGDRRPQLVNMYGITETTVHVTYYPLGRADCERPGSRIGAPLPDLYVRVLDRCLQPTPIGIPGEVYLGGATPGIGLESPITIQDNTLQKNVAISISSPVQRGVATRTRRSTSRSSAWSGPANQRMRAWSGTISAISAALRSALFQACRKPSSES